MMCIKMSLITGKYTQRPKKYQSGCQGHRGSTAIATGGLKHNPSVRQIVKFFYYLESFNGPQQQQYAGSNAGATSFDVAPELNGVLYSVRKLSQQSPAPGGSHRSVVCAGPVIGFRWGRFAG